MKKFNIRKKSELNKDVVTDELPENNLEKNNILDEDTLNENTLNEDTLNDEFLDGETLDEDTIEDKALDENKVIEVNDKQAQVINQDVYFDGQDGSQEEYLDDQNINQTDYYNEQNTGFINMPEYEDFDDTLANVKQSSNQTDDFDDEFDDDYKEENKKSKKSKKEKDSGDGSFVEFMQETVNKIKNWTKNNLKIVYIILGAVVCLAIILVILGVVSKKRSVGITDSVSNNDTLVSMEAVSSVIPVPEDPLEENAYPGVNDLINRYFVARQNNDVETLQSIRTLNSIELIKTEVLSNYVEEYQNITCYTKAGPFPDSYIVYVSYYEKFKDWDVVAPSLLSLLICTKEDGSMYIYSGDLDQNVADYIKIISMQDDVRYLIERINTEYVEVMDINPNFKLYIEALHDEIKDLVGEQLAAEVTVSNNDVDDSDSIDTNLDSDNSENNNDLDNNNDEQTPTTFEVKATTTVNVRASDSEQADKLGRVEAGTVLVCNQQKLNGWSEVIYNGEIGYIKSDYLEVIGGNEDLPETHETVTANDTVNIRATADVNGERVGVAYAGETFDLVEQGNEWTKIIYNGRVAYIKTEYVK